MIIQIILFIFIAIISYLIADIFISRNITQKISKFFNEKNEQYYKDLLQYYEKNKKVKLLTKMNLIHKVNNLIEKARIKERIINKSDFSYNFLFNEFFCKLYNCF